MLIRSLLAGAALLALTAGCGLSNEPEQGWLYQDLRQIDQLDSANPAHELAAVYARRSGADLRLRLDFLEMPELPDYDLYLAVNSAPGGSRSLPIGARTDFDWDALITIPANGQIQAYSHKPGTNAPAPKEISNLRLYRDPSQSIVEISLPAAQLSPLLTSQSQLQIFAAPAGSRTVSDQVGPFSLSSPPPEPARAALIFWNSLPAFSPGQALRRWDGAHTGPRGGRHGLGNLLKAAQRRQAPLVLLDLNQPAALSALAALDQAEQVKELARLGLLTLPGTLPSLPPGMSTEPFGRPPGPAADLLLAGDQAASRAFGVPEQGFLFAPGGLAALRENSPESLELAGLIFLPDPVSSPQPSLVQPLRWQGGLILAIPWPIAMDGQSQQVSPDGLASQTRQMLLLAAGQPGALLMGGDLATSAWGDPQAAAAGLSYLVNHPWIRLLDGQELSRLEPGQDRSLIAPEKIPPQPAPPWLDRLQALQVHDQGGPALAAWQAYRALYAWPQPVEPSLAALRKAYSGQVGALVQAAEWAQNPSQSANCSGDPDFDGQVECLLSSEHVYALFELDYGGYLSHLFIRSQDGQIHQVSAPSTTLISGASPAAGWELSRGALADPRALPGGFFEPHLPAGSAGQAAPDIGPGGLTLAAPGGMVKSFRLLPDGIEITIRGQPDQPLSTSLPVMLDPWLRFSPGWVGSYELEKLSGSEIVMTAPASQLQVEANGETEASLFNDAIDLLRRPEDPNREVPASQNLPFPMGMVYISGQGELTVTVRLSR